MIHGTKISCLLCIVRIVCIFRHVYRDFHLQSAFGRDAGAVESADRLRLLYLQDILDLQPVARYLDTEHAVSLRLSLDIDELLYWSQTHKAVLPNTNMQPISSSSEIHESRLVKEVTTNDTTYTELKPSSSKKDTSHLEMSIDTDSDSGIHDNTHAISEIRPPPKPRRNYLHQVTELHNSTKSSTDSEEIEILDTNFSAGCSALGPAQALVVNPDGLTVGIDDSDMDTLFAPRFYAYAGVEEMEIANELALAEINHLPEFSTNISSNVFESKEECQPNSPIDCSSSTNPSWSRATDLLPNSEACKVRTQMDSSNFSTVQTPNTVLPVSQPRPALKAGRGFIQFDWKQYANQVVTKQLSRRSNGDF